MLVMEGRWGGRERRTVTPPLLADIQASRARSIRVMAGTGPTMTLFMQA